MMDLVQEKELRLVRGLVRELVISVETVLVLWGVGEDGEWLDARDGARLGAGDGHIGRGFRKLGSGRISKLGRGKIAAVTGC